MSRIAAIVLVALLAASCRAGAPQQAEPPTAAATPPARPATAPTPQSSGDPKVDAFLEQLALETEDAATASRHALSVGRRLMNELRYTDARRKLRDAVRLDPTNDEARRLLLQVGFMQGDRTHEIQLVAEEMGDAERVRRSVQVSDLNRWMAAGRRLLDAGKADEAAQLFKRVLDHLEWHHGSSSQVIDASLLETLEKAARAGRTRAEDPAPE